jgi:uncharacterized CHY-type Zn-finger protein
MIRRRETTFHRAVVELSAKSRWCVSGTPIQNSLADLASLLAFIQVKPFHDPRNFHHWISNPFSDKEVKCRAIESLTVLLDAMCLRRTIERVEIPGKQEKIHIVRLTPQERAQYDLMYADMQRFISQQVGICNERASTFGMFQVWLQLRSFCNHGTYQPRFAWAKRNLLDEQMESVRCLTRNSWERCLGCRQPLPIIPRDGRQRYAKTCKHVLCDDCSQNISDPEFDERMNCPLCESLGGPRLGGHASSKLNEESDFHDNYLLPQGYSAKMQALIADVQMDLGTTKR